MEGWVEEWAEGWDGWMGRDIDGEMGEQLDGGMGKGTDGGTVKMDERMNRWLKVVMGGGTKEDLGKEEMGGGTD